MVRVIVQLKPTKPRKMSCSTENAKVVGGFNNRKIGSDLEVGYQTRGESHVFGQPLKVTLRLPSLSCSAALGSSSQSMVDSGG